MRHLIFSLLLVLGTGAANAMHGFIMPDSLKAGDKVAICSPSYGIERKYVEEARELLESQGWKVEVMPHALLHHGLYAGTDEERLSDLRAALLDPEVKAVICARGGYGAVHILQALDSHSLSIEPKWLVGFSDITALHALMNRFGIMSIHGPMPITFGSDEESTERLLNVLKGRDASFTVPSNELNRFGQATGTLIGGNLAVMAHLINTPYDMLQPGAILFIEDVGEPIYKIERIMYQLRLSGVLAQMGGLIVGEFSDYKHDPAYESMESMIRTMVEPYHYPVAFGVPVGHGEINFPVIESATVNLVVAPDSVSIAYVNP